MIAGLSVQEVSYASLDEQNDVAPLTQYEKDYCFFQEFL